MRSSGCWSACLLAACGPHFAFETTPGEASGQCPLCGQKDIGDIHILWTCPAHDQSEVPPISELQNLLATAVQGILSMPCFWLRRLVPADFVKVATPHVDALDLAFVDRDPVERWPTSTYYTDRSCGKCLATLRLRQCCINIAVFVSHTGCEQALGSCAYGLPAGFWPPFQERGRPSPSRSFWPSLLLSNGPQSRRCRQRLAVALWPERGAAQKRQARTSGRSCSAHSRIGRALSLSLSPSNGHASTPLSITSSRGSAACGLPPEFLRRRSCGAAPAAAGPRDLNGFAWLVATSKTVQTKAMAALLAVVRAGGKRRNTTTKPMPTLPPLSKASLPA